MEKEYALYKGEDLLSVGTLDEIAEKMGSKRVTIRQYLFPAYQRRYEKKNKSERNTRVLVRLD